MRHSDRRFIVRDAPSVARTQQAPARCRPAQRGVTLVIVLVFVLLSTLLALWASRTSMFNELVVGNDADYQRAFEAAQALLQDAELDIRGEQADGSPCADSPTNSKVCRSDSAIPGIPLEAKDVSAMLANLAVIPANSPRCKEALCAKQPGAIDFWNNDYANKGVTAAAMMVDGVGARFGTYTGATLGSPKSPANPILADHSATDRGGWYWIEVLPYDESSKTSGLITGTTNPNLLPLNLTPNVVYRITALARGLKPSTLVVLQETYAQQRRKD